MFFFTSRRPRPQKTFPNSIRKVGTLSPPIFSLKKYPEALMGGGPLGFFCRRPIIKNQSSEIPQLFKKLFLNPLKCRLKNSHPPHFLSLGFLFRLGLLLKSVYIKPTTIPSPCSHLKAPFQCFFAFTFSLVTKLLKFPKPKPLSRGDMAPFCFKIILELKKTKKGQYPCRKLGNPIIPKRSAPQ